MTESLRPYRLLFVCSGNICRSPMAEVLARSYAKRRGKAIEVQSAGTLGIELAPADPYAVAVCRELGIDLADHESQGVSRELMEWADYVLAMQLHHAHWLRERYPQHDEKIVMLGNFGGRFEIADPIGSYKFRFRQSRDEIRQCVEVFVDRLPPRESQAGEPTP